eukprot:scaffold32374_cov31-Tisochrysis_lutea.AAC.1
MAVRCACERGSSRGGKARRLARQLSPELTPRHSSPCPAPGDRSCCARRLGNVRRSRDRRIRSRDPPRVGATRRVVPCRAPAKGTREYFGDSQGGSRRVGTLSVHPWDSSCRGGMARPRPLH